MEVHGQFDVKKFYETLARIISKRENVNITVTVTKEESKEPKESGKTA